MIEWLMVDICNPRWLQIITLVVFFIALYGVAHWTKEEIETKRKKEEFNRELLRLKEKVIPYNKNINN